MRPASNSLATLVPLLAVIFVPEYPAWGQTFWIGGFGPGIYASQLLPNGSMAEPKRVANQTNPAFFALHPTLDRLYVVTETMRNDPEHPAALVAYAFDRKAYAAGKFPDLVPMQTQPIQGDSPCHVAIDAQGRWAVVSNYSSGSVSLFPIAADGTLQPECSVLQHEGSGPNAVRQQEPHAHCAAFSPNNRWVLVADLGADRVFVYQIDDDRRSLRPSPHPYLSLPAGSGPRHLAFHPTGKYLYILNELGMTLSAATWNEELGKLELIQSESTVPEGRPVAGGSTAEVVVHPSGRFVYGSNRGPNTIALFSIHSETGGIRRIDNFDTLGKTPRNFCLSPDGRFLLAENQDSDSIYSFRIDSATGLLKPTGYSIQALRPACIRFLPGTLP